MRWIVFSTAIIITMSSVSVLSTSSDICNTLDGIYSPCRCNPNGFYGLVCDNVTSLDTLIDFLRRASEENLLEISIRHSVIHTIPLETVGFLGYIFLNLKEVTLTTLFSGVPVGRVNLEQLHLDNVDVETPWSWQPLSSLMDLKRLSIIRMPLEYIDGHLINYVSPSLQSLTFTSTRTRTISPDGFSKFSNLVYISVQNTEIEELHRNMFPTQSRIKYFYFGKNRITHLPEDIFSNMPELRRVGLQDNAISEINLLTFGKVWNNLSGLFLAGNPIKCECRLEWIISIKRLSTLTGRCHAPKEIYGKKLSLLNKYDFPC